MSNETTLLKGIHALIYRDALGIDFSNRGISARVTEVTVVGPGIDPIFEPTQERPPVRSRQARKRQRHDLPRRTPAHRG
jgi:hypothetical protein